MKTNEMGLYDSQTNETLLADHIYDASLLFQGDVHCLIKYTTAKRGRIAQLCHLDEQDATTGSYVHYHLNEYTTETLAADFVFSRFASAMGIAAMPLAEAVFANQTPK